MKSMFKISIIIPCYNSAHFISSTLDMLISQGLDNCEVIAINDGSYDKTSEILHQYEKENNNFVVIDKKNEGVSVARNVGIEVSKGEYIYFLDSDDSLSPGSLDYYKKIISENKDFPFYCFGYKSVQDQKVIKRYVSNNSYERILNQDEIIDGFLRKRLCINICSCLFNKKFIQDNNIRFLRGVKIGEDLHFLLSVINKANNTYYFPRECFIYQLRCDSAMQGYKSYSESQFNSFVLVTNFLNDNFIGKELYRNFFIANFYLSQLFYYLRSPIKDVEINKQICNYKDVLSTPMKGKINRIVIIRFINFICVKKLLYIFKKGNKK